MKLLFQDICGRYIRKYDRTRLAGALFAVRRRQSDKDYQRQGGSIQGLWLCYVWNGRRGQTTHTRGMVCVLVFMWRRDFHRIVSFIRNLDWDLKKKFQVAHFVLFIYLFFFYLPATCQLYLHLSLKMCLLAVKVKISPFLTTGSVLTFSCTMRDNSY